MNEHLNSNALQDGRAAGPHPISLLMLSLVLLAVGLLAGCQTNTSQEDSTINAQIETMTNSSVLVNLREGDTLKISFPGSPAMDTVEQIRPDGKIRMPLIGEVDAAGLTPSGLEKKLSDLYAGQLSTKEVTVEVENAAFPVYVTGMVLHPGKILSDHPITALDGIMEAGGFDESTANERDVAIIRREGNVMKHYRVNLKAVLAGTSTESFWLKPGDIVYVPERFNFF
jgi:polysaccharide export outer membrane protein